MRALTWLHWMASPRVLLTMTSYRPQVCWWQRAPVYVSSSFLPGCIVTDLSQINNLSIAVRLQCSVTREFGTSVVSGIKDYFRYTGEQAQPHWQRQKLGAGLGQTLCGNFEKEEVWLVGIKKVSSDISRYLLLEAKQIHLLANCVWEWETVYQTLPGSEGERQNVRGWVTSALHDSSAICFVKRR